MEIGLCSLHFLDGRVAIMGHLPTALSVQRGKVILAVFAAVMFMYTTLFCSGPYLLSSRSQRAQRVADHTCLVQQTLNKRCRKTTVDYLRLWMRH